MGDSRKDTRAEKQQDGKSSAAGSMHSEIYITPDLDGDKIVARGKDFDNQLKAVANDTRAAAELTAAKGLTPEADAAWQKAIKTAEAVDQGKLAKQVEDLAKDLSVDLTDGKAARDSLYNDIHDQFAKLPVDRQERILRLQWLQDEAKDEKQKEKIQKDIERLEPKDLVQKQFTLDELVEQSYMLQKLQTLEAGTLHQAPGAVRLGYASALFEAHKPFEASQQAIKALERTPELANEPEVQELLHKLGVDKLQRANLLEKKADATDSQVI